MKRICVFCGSKNGLSKKYTLAARELGKLIAENKFSLVYGGGGIGLMGEISDAVIEKNGEVIGVIPDSLFKKEFANKKVKDLRIVSNMHERKALMAELSDTFIALPGGIGTIEEFSEIVTWAQLGIHNKPCFLLNTDNYYNHFIKFLDHAFNENFLYSKYRSLINIEDEPISIINKIKNYGK